MSQDPPGAPARIRVLVVDDHPAVREGLALLLSSEGVDVCAAAARRADALLLVDAHRPDLAIVDLSLEGEDGRLLVAELSRRALPSLVYSMHDDGRHIEEAFAAGALGYVTKAELRGVLVEAIQAVCERRRFVSPRAAVALAAHVAGAAPVAELDRLSAKEREVYRLIGQGEGTQEIATALRISTHTVESYFARIQLKLGLDGMHDLRRHAIESQRQPDR